MERIASPVSPLCGVAVGDGDTVSYTYDDWHSCCDTLNRKGMDKVMVFYTVSTIKKQQETWVRLFESEDANEKKKLRRKINKLDQVIEGMARKAHDAFTHASDRIPLPVQTVYKNGWFHDSVLIHIRVRKYRTAKLPTVEVTFSYDTDRERRTGTIRYRQVHATRYEQSFIRDYTHFECLFSELFVNEANHIEHNWLLEDMGELHIECESIEWKEA